ncbi:MAG: hypothetical protein M3340_20595 [Actinomycetota bacterium]|nr:hypothetical protein [Actinomycetota bacterium]
MWAAIVAGAGLLLAPAATAQLPLIEPEPRLARVAYSAGGTVRVVAADGSGRTELGSNAWTPAWSPDGGSIAFSRVTGGDDDDDDGNESQIWVAAPDGAGARPLSSVKRGWSAESPTWSPDGRRVAFVRTLFSARSGVTSRLVTVAAEGGDERIVLATRSESEIVMTAPAWSPEGASILFTETRLDDLDAAQSIHAVDLASGQRRRVLRSGSEPAWAPGGDRIAYVAPRPGCEADECHELYVAGADGSGRRRLTTNEAAESSPSWSADGERIAFASTRNYPQGGEELAEVYSVRPDGSCMTWLTNGTADSREPAWEPGAELSTDPGACGATAREPLIETDTSEAAAYRRAPVWWLGPRYGNLLLSHTAVVDRIAFMNYADCAAYEPADCPPPVGVDTTAVCLSSVLNGASGRTVARHEGALVHTPPADLDFEHPYVYTGPSVVMVEGGREGPPPPELLDTLRRFGEDAPPADGLPRAELPVRFWRTLEQTRALRRKLGSVAAVRRRLRVSRETIENRLSLDRRLRRLGPFGRLGCGR